MHKRLFILLSAIAAMPAMAPALNIDNTAGHLNEAVGAEATTIEDLTVRGSIDVTDLVFIDQQMSALRSLDLSEASIVEYSGARVLGLTTHAGATIPARSFVGSAITSIALPSNLMAIGDAAFAGSALESISLSANITAMGVGCFSNCNALKSVEINVDHLSESTFANCTTLETVTIASSTTIATGCFNGCTSLNTVNGSEKISSIGNNAFNNCSALQSFAYGSALQSIGDEAFALSGITSVDLTPCEALLSVGKYAFAFMPEVTAINLGAGPSLGEGIVMNCPKLVDFTFSSTATRVPDFAYTGNTAMDTTYMFNDNVTAIGRYALSGMSQVDAITIPEDVTEIGDNAMERLSGLKRINVPTTVVPTLGENVWAEVEQHLITAYVWNSMLSEFEAADQWKNFEFVGVSPSGVEDAATANSGLRGRVVDGVLYIESTSKALTSVRVYAANGQLLAATGASGLEAQVAVGHLPAQALVVAVMMADSSVATLKIATN